MPSARLFAVTAALLGVAFFSAGPERASAATTLCKAEQAWCAEGNQYPAETQLQATSSKATIAVQLGESTFKVNCSASTLDAESTAQSGAPLPVAISSWSLSGCIVFGWPCTASAQSLPYSGALAWTKGRQGSLALEAGEGQPGVHLLCKNAQGTTQVDCTYSFEPTLDVAGGNPAQLVAASEPMSAAGALCPGSSPTFTADYSVTSPQPLYVANPPVTTFCEAAEPWCAEGNQYPAQTQLEASSSNAAIAIKFLGATYKATCTGSSLKAETGAQSAAPLPIEVTQWSLSGCTVGGWTCTASAQNLPHAGSLAWTKGGQGSLVLAGGEALPGFALLCKDAEEATKLDCTYGFAPTLDLSGGDPAQIVAAEEPMSAAGPLCFGSSPTFTATYGIAAPAPLYAAKPSGGPKVLPTTITEDMTLHAGSPYTGTSTTIESGVTVDAEPGAVIKLTGTLTAKGTLDVNGTDDEPVIFTSSANSAPGQWTGIVLQAGAGASSISHAEVRYAKTGIAIGGGISPTVTSSSLHDSSVKGISASGSSSAITNNTLDDNGEGIIVTGNGSPEIAENTIEDCTGTAISRTISGNQTGQVRIHDNVIRRCGSSGVAAILVRADTFNSVLTGVTLGGNTIADGGGRAIDYFSSPGDDTVPADIDENTISGNASDSVWISGRLDQSTTWQERGFVFVAHDGFEFKVGTGATLTLAPGLVFKLERENTRFNVQGQLIAKGTAADPITFTSLKDDSAGGDTNQDGSATQPAPGDFIGVHFLEGNLAHSPGRGDLDYVHVRYGGDGPNCGLCGGGGPMVRFGGAASGGPTSTPSTIKHSTFGYAEERAVSGSRISEITDSTFVHNGDAIVISGAGNPEIARNAIADCGGHGISEIVSNGKTAEVRIYSNVIERCGSPGAASISVGGDPKSVIVGVTLADNTILDGYGQAINYQSYSSDSSIPPDIDENVISGNSSNAIWLRGRVAQSTSWENRGFVFALGNVAIAEEATLTLAPGLTLKGTQSLGGIDVDGELVANGAPTKPITFTSIKDDSIGGDTNGDGSATIPAPGDWGGLVYSHASGDELEHVAFHFAKAAVDIQFLSVMFIRKSDFVHNEAAIEVRATDEIDQQLASLACVPPYLATVSAHEVWFGQAGLPSPDIAISEVVGAVLPEEYGPLFEQGLALAELVAPLYPAGDTIPFKIYSCPALGIPPTPVTAVLVSEPPGKPWFPWTGP